MLRLILTRHAKSDWDQPHLADHERPLNARGHRSAAAIGKWLVKQGHVPQSALLSTAVRARETWDDLAPAFGRDIPAIWSDDLYLSSPERMITALSSQTANCVILIAHNPGMMSLAQWLAEEPPQRSDFDRFPTCATLVLDFDASDWEAIEPLSGRTMDFVVPRELLAV